MAEAPFSFSSRNDEEAHRPAQPPGVGLKPRLHTMKTNHWVSVFLVCLPLAVQAQSDMATAVQRTWSSEYAVTERGPDYRIWSRNEEEPGPFGHASRRSGLRQYAGWRLPARRAA